MKFVNRQKELSRLNKLASFKTAALAVIWGRRRVGKTRLLLEWAEKKGGVYYVADESAPSIQRKFFSLALEQALPGFSKVEYADWNSFFSRLGFDALSLKWRGPLVIDELPYLIKTSPELPSILQTFIDHDAKKAKLIIVLCGSSQRMMQGAILDESAPLYGRADELIKLSPIAISYMQKALKIKSPKDVIESYSIWGGIPRYWELAARSKGTFYEKIDQLVLDPMGPLSEEPRRLLQEESASLVQLRPILDAVGMGAHRLSEIAGRLATQMTSLNRSIEKLIELDLIERELPYGSDLENSKKTLYKIKDPFVRFWFKVVAPKRSLFSQVSKTMRLQWLKEGLPGLFGATWEDLCRLAVPRLSENWKVIYEVARRYWQGAGPEWDIVSQSHDRSHLLLGEVKWKEKAATASWIYQTIAELKSKGIPPIERRSNVHIQYVLFVTEKPKQLTLPPDVIIVDAKEVIESLD